MPELNLKFKHHLPGDPIPGRPSDLFLVFDPEYVEYHATQKSLDGKECLVYEVVFTFGVEDNFWYAEMDLLADMLEVPAV